MGKILKLKLHNKKKNSKKIKLLYPLAFSALAICSNMAAATEGGGNSYALGVETNYSGLMFNDGLHVLMYYTNYNATHFKNNSGNDNPNFAYSKINFHALAGRFSYIWPGVKWLGASVETRLVLAMMSTDLDLGVSRPAPLGTLDLSGNKTALADVPFMPILLGWHSRYVHQMAGIETVLPFGEYNVNNHVNTGRNYYQIAPAYAVTWLSKDTQFSAKLRYAVNGTNSDTHYRSGDEFSLEFSGGYQLTQKFSAGLNGYIYRQTTDDKQNGVPVNGNGNRGKVDAIGPYLVYKFAPQFSVMAKVQSQFGARNRAEGTAFWLQTKIPF